MPVGTRQNEDSDSFYTCVRIPVMLIVLSGSDSGRVDVIVLLLK